MNFKQTALYKFLIVRIALPFFLKRKYFYGDYAENYGKMKVWFNDTMQGDAIIMRIENTKMRFHPLLPETKEVDVLRASVREQARIHSRQLRKQHQVIIWYVENHFLTRLIGCKAGRENRIMR